MVKGNARTASGVEAGLQFPFRWTGAMDEKIKKLFNEYEKAFSALDFKKNAEPFADTFISAGPKGVIAQDKKEFLKLSQQAADFYKSVGQESARIMGMKETEISKEYSLVTIHWGVKFAKTGDNPVEFDVSYLVQHLPDQDPQIILFIAHQDEEEAMKKLGLVEKT
jgi:hypothetical protein